uniref:ATP synthase protein 8 n=1 Tax=Xylohypha bantiana TaxID=89940 RepID=A0A192ID76_XYLBA|nr:Atp8 [Cladophialophora bantiana]ANK79147.1 Atp8 [Cladophialophora bantiana]
MPYDCRSLRRSSNLPYSFIAGLINLISIYCIINLYIYFWINNLMPQLIPFFFVNQVTYNFLLLIIIIYLFSKYILPRFVRLFKTRIFLKTLESNKNTTI